MEANEFTETLLQYWKLQETFVVAARVCTASPSPLPPSPLEALDPLRKEILTLQPALFRPDRFQAHSWIGKCYHSERLYPLVFQGNGALLTGALFVTVSSAASVGRSGGIGRTGQPTRLAVELWPSVFHRVTTLQRGMKSGARLKTLNTRASGPQGPSTRTDGAVYEKTLSSNIPSSPRSCNQSISTGPSG